VERSFFAFLVSCLIVFTAVAAEANAGPIKNVWFAPGFSSIHPHFSRSSSSKNAKYNNSNLGTSFELDLNYEGSKKIVFGRFTNSVDLESNYLGYLWSPFEANIFSVKTRIGAISGIINGYPSLNNRHLSPLVLPVISFEWKRVGINIIYVPPVATDSAISFQFKVVVF